jgi:hypothetical protein
VKKRSVKLIIASFWTGKPLSFFEQVSLKSFEDWGYRTILYSYMSDLNVPPGVELADARDIMPEPTDINRYGGFAQFADIFRINMIKKTGAVWVDCDVACLGIMPDLPYLFAKSDRRMGNAVLRLPQDSPALDYLVQLFNAEELVFPPDWPWAHLFSDEVKAQPDKENGYKISTAQRKELPYMTFGPVALTYALNKTGEISHQLPEELFYPVHRISLRRNYFRPHQAKVEIPVGAVTVHHIGGKPFRKKFDKLGECTEPHPDSFIALLCDKHGIVPANALMEISPIVLPESDLEIVNGAQF